MASAADWSVWGGRLVEKEQSAIRAHLGWGTEVSYHFLVQRKVELAPKLGLTFGSPIMALSSLEVLRDTDGDPVPGDYVYGQCCGIGNTIGTELRYSLFQKGPVHMAVKGEVGILLDYAGTQGREEETSSGLRIGGGIAMNYSVYYEMNMVAGADIVADTYFLPVVTMLPIMVRGGIEYMMDESLALFAISRFGPGFTIFGPGVVDIDAVLGAVFAVDGYIGVAYRFGAPEDLRYGSSNKMRPIEYSGQQVNDSW